MTNDCQYILDYLDCEYELFENTNDGAFIVEAYERMSKQGKQDGFIPLIIVVSNVLAEMIEYVLEEIEDEPSPDRIHYFRQQVIKDAMQIHVPQLLEQRWKESIADEDEFDDEHSDLYGDFIPAVAEHELYSYLNGTVPYSEIIIARIPTMAAWELAAWVPMGGFNDCPPPEEQVAVFKYWYDHYGAIPAIVSHDTWELKLTRPPADNHVAELLAREHFAFCSDRVYQAEESTATIRSLASHLKHSTTWYFWWD